MGSVKRTDDRLLRSAWLHSLYLQQTQTVSKYPQMRSKRDWGCADSCKSSLEKNKKIINLLFSGTECKKINSPSKHKHSQSSAVLQSCNTAQRLQMTEAPVCSKLLNTSKIKHFLLIHHNLCTTITQLDQKKKKKRHNTFCFHLIKTPLNDKSLLIIH